jgi:hypothetical protein
MASREEDELIKSQKAANTEFRNATRTLQKAANESMENSLRQELGLTREGVRASLEDKLLGSGMKRTIYNFILDKRKAKQLQKESGLTKEEYKALRKEEKARKKALNVAKANENRRKARDAALTATLGEEQAAIRIQALNAQDNAQIIADAQIQAEASKSNDEKEIADAAKKKAEEEALAAKEEGQINSLTEAANSIMEAFTDSDIAASFQSFADSLQTVISASGVEDSVAGQELVAEQIEMLRMEQRGEGESPAERDKQKAEIKAASDKQIDLLQKIADNVSGGGGGGGGDEGSGGGDGGGGMLGKLGAGLGALGKGIGVLLKFAGKGLMIFLQSFARGIMSFANPLVIGGLAVFTIGMIGLGAALRLAAPAFEAIAPVLIKVADVIGNVLMTAIKEVPAILREIGGVITAVGTQIRGIIDSIGNSIRKIGSAVKEVLDGISGVITAIGDTISGVITSVAEGIATVVNAVKGDAKAEAEAQIAVLEAQTLSIQKLSKIDPGTMAATASGIESIKEALDGLGSPGLLGSLGKMLGGGGPISELLELAKNSQGITDASNALNAFVKNAELFEKGVKVDDSVIEGIEKVVKALGSGNPAGLSAFDKAINSINGLDASKISLLQGIKIPEITPQTAAEYEKVFNAMQKNQPSLIEKVSSTLGRFFGSSEKSGSGGTGRSGGQPAGSPSTSLASASKEVASANVSRDQKRINKLKAQIADPNTKSSIKSRARKKLRMLEQAQAAGMTRENVMKSGGSMSAKFRQGEMVSASPPVAGAAAGGGGGNVSISAPTSTSNQSTSTYPITSRPNNLALDRIRSSLDF